MVGFSIAFVPLSWMVDLLPSLRFLPWLSFQKTARRLRAINYRVLTEAYSFVKRQMARGTYKPSITSGLIGQYKERFESDPGLEVAVQSAVAFTYGAGADTTSASLHGFVLSMVRNPEVQRKAQEEIDRVIGSERLPNADDRDSLLYVSALVQEVMRWFPIVPANTTHAVDEEFHYNGYRFPKGSYITVSNWAILHDPQTYPDPFSFTPERYLEPRNEPSPANWAFGHGRRICPGRYLADGTLFVTISRLLATFSIERALDEKANPLDAKIGYTPGLVSHPTDFPFAIKPRSAAHAEFVRSLEKDCPWEDGHAKLLQEVSGTTSV